MTSINRSKQDETPGVSRRRMLNAAAMGLAGAVALPLVGCSSSNNTPSPIATVAASAGAGAATRASGAATAVAGAATSAAAASATSASTVKPKQGGTWNRGAGNNIALATLPYQEAGTLAGGGSAAANDLGLVWGQLVRLAPDKLSWEPDHAKEWQLAPDGQSIKFVIRDDIYFHSGRKFTTKDIAFGLEQLKDKKWNAGTSYNLNPVADYTIVDDYTMQWTFKPQSPTVFEFMSIFRLADQDTFDQITKGTLVGTGAFKWTNFDPVKGATLEAYDKYHLGRPLLDKIQYTVFADAAALAVALETGEIDDSALSAEESTRFYTNKKFNTVKLPAGSGMTPITFRTDLDPLQDKRVRQAIGFLLDRQRYQQEGFLPKFDELGRLPWPTVSPAYDKELDQPIYDRNRARDLLKQAGFANGVPTTIKIDTLPIRAYSPAIAQLLQQEGQAVGLKFEFAALEYNSMLDRYYKGQLDNLWLGFGDASSALSPVAAVRASSTIGNDVIHHYQDQDWTAARDAIRNGANDGAAYKRFNNAYLDGAFQLPLSRAVPVNFESSRIHIERNFLGGVTYHKVWVS